MKRKVQAWGIGSRVFTIDDEATKGAVVGKNVYNPDGKLFVPAVAVCKVPPVEAIIRSPPAVSCKPSVSFVKNLISWFVVVPKLMAVFVLS